MQPVAFTAPIDIMNRALQRVGQTRIQTLTDDSKACDEVTFCYDKLRIAEMRRNVWRFSIRTVALRPYNPPAPASGTTAAQPGTMLLVPAIWSTANNYIPGSLVSFGTRVYFSRTANAASEPDLNPADWAQYFGPRTVSPYNAATTYFPGELVYVLTGTTPVVFMCLVQATPDTPGSVPAWVATTYYSKGDRALGSDTNVYQSLLDLNSAINPVGDAGVHWKLASTVTDQPDARTGQGWLQLDATVRNDPFIYPVGSGPAFQPETYNVFFLPYGFLREAPQDPKDGGVTFLGGPSGNQYNDWQFNGNFIITRQQDLILLRFAADIADVAQMDSMFCEGLSCRVAGEVCEPLTQSTSKLQAIMGEYKVFMGDARAVNGIEQGPIEAPEDDFITVRM